MKRLILHATSAVVLAGALLLGNGYFSATALAAGPGAPKMSNPCAPKMSNPCAPKMSNPCAPKMSNPCAPKMSNPCAPKMSNPCGMKGASATAHKVDPKLVTRPAGTKLKAGKSADLIKEGKQLWDDKKLSTNGLSCSSCHKDNAAFNATFTKPYPHNVKMAQDQAGMKTINLDEVVQFCLTVPMAGKSLPWDSRELAALTAYTAEVQKTFKPKAAHPGGGKMMGNPCGGKPMGNPCGGKMMGNPCATK